MPVLKQHLLELEPVYHWIVSTVVVHRHMRPLGLPIEHAGCPRDLFQFLLAVEVVVLLNVGALPCSCARKPLKLRPWRRNIAVGEVNAGSEGTLARLRGTSIET
jgi:hypothetical protein